MERWSERSPGALSGYWGLSLGAMGTRTGLWYREATGQGQDINASMSPAAHAIWGRAFSSLPLRPCCGRPPVLASTTPTSMGNG
jgi:hypothetical protein